MNEFYVDYFVENTKITLTTNDMSVKGISLLGIRHNHKIWNDWLIDGIKLNQLKSQLHKANFDPEFSEKYEDALISKL